jgi:NTP-dependent ternary system trypsin peptidase co-occuring protein
MDDDRELVPVELGDDRTVLVEVRRGSSGEEDVSALGRLPWDDIGDSIDAVTGKVQAALARAKPRRATVEFGLDIGLESGQLTSVLVKGSGSATLTITLEWEAEGAGQ